MSKLENALLVEAHLDRAIDGHKLRTGACFDSTTYEPMCVLGQAMWALGTSGQEFFHRIDTGPSVDDRNSIYVTALKLKPDIGVHTAAYDIAVFFDDGGSNREAAQRVVALIKEYGDDEA